MMAAVVGKFRREIVVQSKCQYQLGIGLLSLLLLRSFDECLCSCVSQRTKSCVKDAVLFGACFSSKVCKSYWGRGASQYMQCETLSGIWVSTNALSLYAVW